MIHTKKIIFSLPKITLSTYLMLCFLFTSVQSQEVDDKSRQLSLEVYPQWYSDEDYSIQGNIGIEKEFQNNSWNQYYIKPSAAYALDNNWALHGGLGGYYRDYQDEQNRWEVRPYMGVSHYYSWTDEWRLSAYLRAEERYFSYSGDNNSSNITRLRFRLRSSYTFDTQSFMSSWDKFTMGAEVFKSQNNDESSDNPDDNYDFETRITFGLERKLDNQRKLRFELSGRYQSTPGQVSSASISTIYFKVKYYPVWGERLRNRLLDREIEE